MSPASLAKRAQPHQQTADNLITDNANANADKDRDFMPECDPMTLQRLRAAATGPTKKIYIPMYKGYTGFQRFGVYDQAILGSQMDEDEFQRVIDNISKVVQIMYSRKRMADNQGIAPYKIFITIVSCMLFVTFLIMEYQALLSDDIQMQFVGYSLFGFGFVMMGGLTLYESTRDSRHVVFHFSEKVKTALEHYLQEISEVHVYRGIQWVFNDTIKCIECRVSHAPEEQVEEVVPEESVLSNDSVEKHHREMLRSMNRQI